MAPTSVVAGRLPLARPFHAFSMLWRPRSAGGGGHPGAAGPQPLDQLRQGAGPQLGVEAADALEPLPRQAERVAARAAAQAGQQAGEAPAAAGRQQGGIVGLGDDPAGQAGQDVTWRRAFRHGDQHHHAGAVQDGGIEARPEGPGRAGHPLGTVAPGDGGQAGVAGVVGQHKVEAGLRAIVAVRQGSELPGEPGARAAGVDEDAAGEGGHASSVRTCRRVDYSGGAGWGSLPGCRV